MQPPILDLRQAIVQRVQNNDKQQLEEVITGSVGHDERTLPGLGVLFEMIWKEIDAQEQSKLVDVLYNHLQQLQPVTGKA
ncbi:small acid-soluble spore protein SspI [Paenibacillus radicis (ex Gao et al. 2016)]|uniref:Small, acid-soluble spore protein I n=1 Tax=Paenibacillus radicis (ex Gao et al. 2016) TaxID=1737354 RepID=A0A917HES0_9BACL|nr:small acid-soluble spore protein SspI [Paenibacillus radicis (ex Gao et al. 2016)]GGG76212.1 small, acid-soluble spore protein I [Paenibacillus radicis (ex Gao et al. 2016)]